MDSVGLEFVFEAYEHINGEYTFKFSWSVTFKEKLLVKDNGSCLTKKL
jgi:hypothetical protein